MKYDPREVAVTFAGVELEGFEHITLCKHGRSTQCSMCEFEDALNRAMYLKHLEQDET